ncbi:hypothetical protein BD779DRAFT_1507646 [Infundibulicybe gibba]|nr:hypothetical protein BD779DRAFT_1507646 [Infundibulicybe gibba]
MSGQKATQEDLRDMSLETKFTLPKSWYRESSDGLSSSSMFLGGLIMVSRNRFLAWPSVLFATNGIINQHPLRSKDGSGSSWSSLLLCIFALLASYLPLFIVTNPSP